MKQTQVREEWLNKSYILQLSVLVSGPHNALSHMGLGSFWQQMEPLRWGPSLVFFFFFFCHKVPFLWGKKAKSWRSETWSAQPHLLGVRRCRQAEANNSLEKSVWSRGYFWWGPPRLLFLSAGERGGEGSLARALRGAGLVSFSATCLQSSHFSVPPRSCSDFAWSSWFPVTLFLLSFSPPHSAGLEPARSRLRTGLGTRRIIRLFFFFLELDFFSACFWFSARRTRLVGNSSGDDNSCKSLKSLKVVLFVSF